MAMVKQITFFIAAILLCSFITIEGAADIDDNVAKFTIQPIKKPDGRIYYCHSKSKDRCWNDKAFEKVRRHFYLDVKENRYVSYGALQKGRINCRSKRAQENCPALPPASNEWHRACTDKNHCKRHAG